jgi:hypothetical protein
VLKYTSLEDDLYRRTIDDVLLKCLGEEHAKVAVWEVHDGMCGAHYSTYKMNWLLRRAGFYWPTMMDDCIKYQKGCEVCQCHTPFREIGNEASIRVPRMFKSHAWQQYDKQMQCY